MMKIRPIALLLIAPMSVTLLGGLAGCGRNDRGGGEWNGVVVVQPDDDRDYHPEAFHADDHRQTVDQGRDRGRASMGARTDDHR
jgi:hypothetical protein